MKDGGKETLKFTTLELDFGIECKLLGVEKTWE
jgi:hypothetical protein